MSAGELELIKAALDSTSVLAITVDAEARGDWREGFSSVEERIACGSVIRNRVMRGTFGGSTYQRVCWAPRQFSCWAPLEGESNFKRTIAVARYVLGRGPWPTNANEHRLFDETLFLAQGIVAGVILDQTGGATHYYAPKAMKPAGRVPTWAKGKPARQIGSQLFLIA